MSRQAVLDILAGSEPSGMAPADIAMAARRAGQHLALGEILKVVEEMEDEGLAGVLQRSGRPIGSLTILGRRAAEQEPKAEGWRP
jgi:hypothetical protein